MDDSVPAWITFATKVVHSVPSWITFAVSIRLKTPECKHICRWQRPRRRRSSLHSKVDDSVPAWTISAILERFKNTSVNTVVDGKGHVMRDLIAVSIHDRYLAGPTIRPFENMLLYDDSYDLRVWKFFLSPSIFSWG